MTIPGQGFGPQMDVGPQGDYLPFVLNSMGDITMPVTYTQQGDISPVSHFNTMGDASPFIYGAYGNRVLTHLNPFEVAQNRQRQLDEGMVASRLQNTYDYSVHDSSLGVSSLGVYPSADWRESPNRYIQTKNGPVRADIYYAERRRKGSEVAQE